MTIRFVYNHTENLLARAHLDHRAPPVFPTTNLLLKKEVLNPNAIVVVEHHITPSIAMPKHM